MRTHPQKTPVAKLLLAALLCATGLAGAARAQSAFAYTDSSRVVTLEFKSDTLAIINVINFTDTAFVLEPHHLVGIKRNGLTVVGQVFTEIKPGNVVVYSAFRMIPPRAAMGTDILGAFQFDQDMVKIYLSWSGRFLELEALSSERFESLMGRLAELDLTVANVPKMFQQRQIPDLGVYIPYEEGDAVRDLHDGCLTADGINPPRIIKRPQPRLTPEAAAAGFAGVVEAIARMDPSGNVSEIRLSPEPPHGMAERIRETIRNSWKFLPATYNGEVVATEIRFTLQYGDVRAPEQNPQR
ncbi:MAG TPA: energy transducer TonB [Acidobacteriota bacterium]|nr:energy transducer TonB [Acidobacteriota bacterium]HQG90943.1 energy transducer TonB [Acidobacteriota bacterium]